jgi:hypothetical protein
MFGLAPLTRHGIDTTEGRIEKQVVHRHQGGGKINRGSAPVEGDFRWRMKSQMQMQDQITTLSAYLQES